MTLLDRYFSSCHHFLEYNHCLVIWYRIKHLCCDPSWYTGRSSKRVTGESEAVCTI